MDSLNKTTSHTTPETNTPDTMSIIDHLKELRVRLIFCLIYLTIGTIILFTVSGYTFDILAVPYFAHFPKNSLIGTGPAEAFILKLKIAFFASILITSPLLFHQLWLFIRPGLYDHERKLVVPFVTTTTLLFLFGSWLSYQIILPVTYEFFFEQYASISVTPQIRISEHLSLTIRLMLGFGICFEAPVLTFFLARLGLLTSTILINSCRYAVVAVFILAGIITPTGDILTQIIFAVPLLGLYGISILVAKWVEYYAPATQE
jgi:sec-independent protein translocase protein TatC